MANGGYWHTQAEWLRVEGPLLQLDPILTEFAEKSDLHVTKNHKNWPERFVVWGRSIRLLIQVYLESAEDLTFTVWVCGSQDRDGRRYWQQEKPIEGKRVAEFRDSFMSILREAKVKLDALSEVDLEFVTNVARFPPAA